MNYTEPFLRKVELGKEEQQHHNPPSGVSYRAAVAANNQSPTITIYLVF